MIEVRTFAVEGPVEIVPKRFEDTRGFFVETYNRARFREAGIDADWVQDNHSLSRQRGVLRGLHFQVPPSAQAKLVRVSRGAIFDVAVDIRRSSPTYRRWVGVELTAESGNQLFVPEGFAHGFVTLVDDCEVQYKVSGHYDPQADRAVRYDDPAIGITWPDVGGYTLSDKDAAAPMLAEIETGF